MNTIDIVQLVLLTIVTVLLIPSWVPILGKLFRRPSIETDDDQYSFDSSWWDVILSDDIEKVKEIPLRLLSRARDNNEE